MEPLVVGTIAIFEVMSPSTAFRVEAVGRSWPSAHKVRYPKELDGTTVALKTYACAVLGGAHELPATFTVSSPLNAPFPLRVSITRQGATGYKDKPPVPGGAK